MGEKTFLPHVAKLVNTALSAADTYTSRVSAIPAGDNACNRTLSSAGGSDKGGKAAGRQDHIHAL